MKKSSSKLIALFGILFAIVALVATVSAALVYFDKKKDDEELEHYLDCSIQ